MNLALFRAPPRGEGARGPQPEMIQPSQTYERIANRKPRLPVESNVRSQPSLARNTSINQKEKTFYFNSLRLAGCWSRKGGFGDVRL